MITRYEESDESVWIPVAQGLDGGPARAFLPSRGFQDAYRYGYKAETVTAPYFEALSEIQQAYIDGDSRIFLVNKGTKKERQSRACWRHGNKTGAPHLGPSLGWVAVAVSDLEKLSDHELETALRVANKKFATLSPPLAKPVLCRNPSELDQEVARIYGEGVRGIPMGQGVPEKLESTTHVFVRDAQVVAFTLQKAQGKCECCQQPAPFVKASGLPFLEVHHVKRLASGGSDRVSNAVAVCPNCHRELHHGARAKDLADELYTLVQRLIRE